MRLGRALVPAVALLFALLAIPTYVVREEMLTTIAAACGRPPHEVARPSAIAEEPSIAARSLVGVARAGGG